MLTYQDTLERTMQVYEVDQSTGYRGAGRAWAAIKNGQVADIRYMGDWHELGDVAPMESRMPAWVYAMYISNLPMNEHDLQYTSPKKRGELKKAAIAAGRPAHGPRGGHIMATTIIREAMRIAQEAEKAAFTEWREKCRTELSEIGNVVGGMCSCHQFVVNS